MDLDFDRFTRPKWSDKVNVYVTMNFMRIIDIDTINQSFQAEVIVESKWHDPTVDINDEFDPKKCWIPQLYIDNSLNDVREDVSYKIVYDKKLHRHVVLETRKLKGLFWEHLELERFPLDIQNLNITLTTKAPGHIVNLILLDKPIRMLEDVMRNNLDKSLWELQNTVWTAKGIIKREFSYGTYMYPSLTLTARVFRLAGFYYWNVVLPIFLVTAASLCPFVIDSKLPQSRIPSTATMLLTLVSLRWLIRAYLPTISYLTIVDKYSIGSMVIIIMLLVYHATMGAIHHLLPVHVTPKLDKLVFLVFVILITSKQMALFGWIVRTSHYRSRIKSVKFSFLVDKIASEVSKNANSNEVFI